MIDSILYSSAVQLVKGKTLLLHWLTAFFCFDFSKLLQFSFDLFARTGCLL
jgi:hypothetical protein